MDAKTLIEMVNTRLEAGDNNPTRKSFLYELVKALERLDRYESSDVPHKS